MLLGQRALKSLRHIQYLASFSSSAQERGLVVTDPKAKDIVKEHWRYSADKANERHFQGDVLGYITPWNGHGYDIAKMFGSKFTSMSPVWLQIRRRGKESYHITGLHDVDQGRMPKWCNFYTYVCDTFDFLTNVASRKSASRYIKTVLTGVPNQSAQCV
uniref:Uncharacterized protein n=1 Tax=Erpetoichthys calabaricus TaxID=27687 RepID=A0A8C4RVZ1_ERPCA